MSIITDYKVEERIEGKILVVTIKPYFTEFAAEGEDITTNTSLREEIYTLIKKKFSDSKIIMCKIMIGGLLIGTIYSPSLPVAASSYDTYVGDTVNYIVKSGDTLWDIAVRYDTSVDALKQYNNLLHTTIYVDQVLKIPSNTVSEYIVQSGDTLYQIAKAHGTTVERIKEQNNLLNDIIYPSQILLIETGENVGGDTTAEPNISTYTVKPYDTLWKIAIEHHISIDQLKVMNDLKGDTIYVGQVLNLVPIQEGGIEYVEYTVKSGDTQWSIAIDHGIPVPELQTANNIYENTVLTIGQVLKVPVHTIAVMEVVGEQYGEYMDWWDGAQYVFPINKEAVIRDVVTGQEFNIKRTIGANHADCEPMTYEDTQIAKVLWGEFSWKTRPVLVMVDGRKLAASMSFMPHGTQYIRGNNFDGHFDIHFLNSTRHVDGAIDNIHQETIKIAAGLIE